jgi:hypothetical protein
VVGLEPGARLAPKPGVLLERRTLGSEERLGGASLSSDRSFEPLLFPSERYENFFGRTQGPFERSSRDAEHELPIDIPRPSLELRAGTA